MLTEEPLTENESNNLKFTFQFNSISLSIATFLLVLATGAGIYTKEPLLLVMLAIFPTIWVMNVLQDWVMIRSDLRKGIKYVKEGIITEQRNKQSYSRTHYTMSYYCLVKLDNNPKEFKIKTPYSEHPYQKGTRVRILYAPHSEYIFSMKIIDRSFTK